MTASCSGQTSSDQAFSEDIAEDVDPTSARLDREADAILLDGEGQAPPLRRAVREDVTHAREWGQERAVRMRGAVEAEPVKATLYALAIGVVIGLLAAR